MIDFKNTYNQDEILDFLKNSFLKDFQKDIRAVDIRDKKNIQKAYYLGYSPELELSVFEFLHEGGTEKRVALTTEAFNVLRDSGDFKAIGIFHSKDTADWRFSLMTATPVVDEKGKVKTTLSNPKRYSFLLGPNAKVNTPTRFLINKGEIQSFDDLKERFSIEVVNKEFYREISKLFIQLVGGTLGKGKNQGEYKALLELPGIKDSSQTAQEFAVRLIGRLIFCWFLREKKNGTQQSLMPHSLLSLEASVNHKNYYHNILEPIFFKVLNVPLSSRKEEKYVSDPYDKIPYLNGGLFSPHDDDFYSTNKSKQEDNNKKVVVPDKWLQGLFEVLETYNFTIDENSAFDEELSIDPEMLGRIFENLLAEINPETGESARKSTGSYYTPRVIVDYMVDESLYLYLRNKTDIEEEKLRSLISYDLDDDTHTPLMEDEKEKIIAAIDELKILDPACGSGAFPMGILQKIVFILQQLDPNGQYWFKAQIKNIPIELRKDLEREHQEKNFDYIRKLGVIRRNIFGVDIQPIATEISRLRCFLTLIVDQKVDDNKENRGIDPLPNLDFKFVTANSLVSLPEKKNSEETIGMFEDSNRINELKDVRDQFFNASNFERIELKDQFRKIQLEMSKYYNSVRSAGADLTKMLLSWDPFSHKMTEWFDPEWMFGIKEGFDIVIGNPPYNQLQKDSGRLANLYKDKNYQTFSRSGDLYCLFYERGNELLTDFGFLAYITSNKWMRAGYGENLRSYLSKNTTPVVLIDLGSGVFDNATVDTNILIFRKGFSEPKTLACTLSEDLSKKKEILLREYIKERSIILDKFSKDNWLILSPIELSIKDKIEKCGIPLKNWDIKINRGILTGYNEAFIINGKKRKELIAKDPKSAEIIRPILRGRDIKRYKYKITDLYLINTHNGIDEKGIPPININDYPAIKEHLDNYYDKIKQRKDQGVTPYNLRSCAYMDDFNKQKIIFQEMVQSSRFIIDNDGKFLCLDTARIMTGENLEILLSILNSNLFFYAIKTFYGGGGLGKTGVRMKHTFFSKFHIPIFSSEEEYTIKSLVKSPSDENLKEIENIIYKSFDLDVEEMKFISSGVNS